MDKKTFEEWSALLDSRTEAAGIRMPTSQEKQFLWKELEHKRPETVDAIWKWLESGTETDLRTTTPKGEMYSVEGLRAGTKISYLSAALTLDWIAREPGPALELLKWHGVLSSPQ
jgi:hypothetical protein